jgi:uncharacterized membrane protein YoaK (UPF0700 family)
MSGSLKSENAFRKFRRRLFVVLLLSPVCGVLAGVLVAPWVGVLTFAFGLANVVAAWILVQRGRSPDPTSLS